MKNVQTWLSTATLTKSFYGKVPGATRITVALSSNAPCMIAVKVEMLMETIAVYREALVRFAECA